MLSFQVHLQQRHLRVPCKCERKAGERQTMALSTLISLRLRSTCAVARRTAPLGFLTPGR